MFTYLTFFVVKRKEKCRVLRLNAPFLSTETSATLVAGSLYAPMFAVGRFFFKKKKPSASGVFRRAQIALHAIQIYLKILGYLNYGSVQIQHFATTNFYASAGTLARKQQTNNRRA